jgi:hypothetical protein
VVAALDLGPAVADQAGDHVERLVEDRGADPGAGLVAEVAEVHVGRLAEAHTEHGTPTGQVVEGDQVLGDHPRSPSRERRDHRAQQHPLGDLGDRPEQHPRVVHVLHVVPAEVVPEEEAVPARGLGRAGQVDHDGRVRERRDAQQVAHPGHATWSPPG